MNSELKFLERKRNVNRKPRAKSDKPRTVQIEVLTREMFRNALAEIEQLKAAETTIAAELLAVKVDIRNDIANDTDSGAIERMIALNALAQEADKRTTNAIAALNKRTRRMILALAANGAMDAVVEIATSLADYFPATTDEASEFWAPLIPSDA